MRIIKGLLIVGALSGIALAAVWTKSATSQNVSFLPRPVLAPTAQPAPANSAATIGESAPAPTVVAQVMMSPPIAAKAPPAIPAAAPQSPATQSAAPQAIPAALAAPKSTCTIPGALGVSRVVEIDTTGGPGFGFEHFKMHDFLQDKEVVLTFDDGPWPVNTPMVLKALADECVKAIFFPIGKHATYYPDILKHIAEQGHTVGSHTWSHANLQRVKSEQEGKDEIEKGFSAVRWALGVPPAPFFRFPALQHPPLLVTYLGERNVGIFSTDFDSFDFKMRKPEQVIASVMAKLHKVNKGIILMHDFQHATAAALPTLLRQLKTEGFKVVHMRARGQIQTLAKYDEELVKDQKLPTVSTKPTSSVVRTVTE